MVIDHIEEMKELLQRETDPEKKALTAKNLADDLWHKGLFDESRQYAEKAIRLGEENHYFEIVYLSYSTIGITYSIQGEHLKAREYFETAYQKAKEIEIPGAILKCLINLGICEQSSGNPEKALDCYYESLKIAEQENDNTLKSKLYNNIGIVLTDLKEYKDALYYLKYSLKFQIHNQDLTDIGNSMINIGNIYLFQHDIALASGYYKRAIRLYEEQNHINLMYVYNNMASIYEEKKQIHKAIDYYLKVIELCKQQNNQLLLFQSYQSTFKAYFSAGDRENADKYYSLCEEMVPDIADKNVLMTYYNNAAQYLKTIEEYKKSTEVFTLLINLKNELSDIYFNDRVAEIKTKLDYEHKKQEAELYRQKSIQLSQYNQQIDQQKEELIYLNKSKDTILNIVSHDLKNSIGAVTSLLDIINAEKRDNHLDKYYQMIHESANKALDLVKDILDVSRIEMQDYKLTLSRVNLYELMESYQENLRSYADLKKIKIEFLFEQNDYQVFLNEKRFWQIIYNLITNAIKFTQREGEIIISTRLIDIDHAPWVCICIKDNGIGIDEEFIPYLFDKFSKASRKGTEGESTTGLGLSIVKKLTELQNGKIIVKSKSGEGTEFSLLFPVIQK